ncbi:MAG: hypothetical protein WEA61_01435 [Anaerolineales bacterium]
MTLLLGAAIVAWGFGAWAEARKARLGARLGRLAFYAALLLWVWLQAGEKAFRGSETSLLGWFIFGLAVLALSEVLEEWGGVLRRWCAAGVPMAAILFALGFDVLRPDAYSYVPAALLGLLVLAVAVRAYLRLASGLKRKAPRQAQLGLALYVAAVGVMVYAAVFKVIDRGWALPWAYMAAGGALLFGTGQLWMGWGKLLRSKTVPGWLRQAAMDLGVLLMVAAAFFVYEAFL